MQLIFRVVAAEVSEDFNLWLTFPDGTQIGVRYDEVEWDQLTTEWLVSWKEKLQTTPQEQHL